MALPIQIIKNRSDIGAGTRGSDMGIDAIEIAAINQNNDIFHKTPYLNVETHNETIYNKVRTTFAKRIRFVYEQCMRVCSAVKQTVEQGKLPIILSGDHSSALGSISGIKAASPQKILGVVWIDAHADIHSPHTSPSGNVHGMPLSAALNLDTIKDDAGKNKVTEETAHYWEKIKAIGIAKPKLDVNHLVYVGVRSVDKPEKEVMQKLGIKKYTIPEMRYRGIATCMHEIKERLHTCNSIYVGFDVDSLDCHSVSNGTGTPVPKGFATDEVKEIIHYLTEQHSIAGFEIAEINPLLDFKGNKMAETAFDVLQFFIKEYSRLQ